MQGVRVGGLVKFEEDEPRKNKGSTCLASTNTTLGRANIFSDNVATHTLVLSKKHKNTSTTSAVPFIFQA